MKNQVKEPVKLRKKKLLNGSESLFLTYQIQGTRRYEYLQLYILPEVDRATKKKNQETMQLAEAVKAKKIIELQNGRLGFEDNFKLDTPFLEYYRGMCAERFKTDSKGNWGNWNSCLIHLEKFCTEKTTFRDIDQRFVKNFREYLDKTATIKDKRKFKDSRPHIVRPLSQNTKQSYFNKLRACINQALEDKILIDNPLRGVDGFKDAETERVFLTLDEVKALAATECNNPYLKKAFLFSCLTGLRSSDIEHLRWGDIHISEHYKRIVFKQKKTKGQEYLDITEQAYELIGERPEDSLATDLIFTGYRYNVYMLLELKKWCLEAGINKKVTFHSARHSFAILMLELDVDIYTLSKLLGHKDLKTTQIYAKVLDKKKQEAVAKIPKLPL